MRSVVRVESSIDERLPRFRITFGLLVSLTLPLLIALAVAFGDPTQHVRHIDLTLLAWLSVVADTLGAVLRGVSAHGRDRTLSSSRRNAQAAPLLTTRFIVLSVLSSQLTGPHFDQVV